MGFFKFAFFASLGELVSFRILVGKWSLPGGFLPKAFLWGCLGVLIAFSFEFYTEGVKALIASGRLPGGSGGLGFAFFTSLFNNLTFAPMMMAFHKLIHSYIDLNLRVKRPLSEVFDFICWKDFFFFVCLKKIPFFWIPVHTLTFLMPEGYRVLFASFLSFLLGMLLTGKRENRALKANPLL